MIYSSFRFCSILFLLVLNFNASSQGVSIRIVDVGAGLGTITTMPNGELFVYDVGRYSNRFKPTLDSIANGRDTIDLVILSHNDADHIGSLKPIADDYFVKRIIFSTFRNDKCHPASNKVYCKAIRCIELMRSKGTIVDSVTNFSPKAGDVLYDKAGAKVTYLCGFNDPYSLWKFSGSSLSKPRNAISIVVRLDYDEKSIIYGGDAVGKLPGDESCVYTEKYMLDNLEPSLLDADVIISPHHGADNGGCSDFIKAVSPKFVVFSAGSEYGHPRSSTAMRYLNNGVKIENIFRTDKGDDEEDYEYSEWSYGEIDGCEDSYGDDDIDIYFSLLETNPKVTYSFPSKSFCK